MKPKGNRKWLKFWTANLSDKVLEYLKLYSGDDHIDLKIKGMTNEEYYLFAESIGLIVDDGTGTLNDDVARAVYYTMEHLKEMPKPTHDG